MTRKRAGQQPCQNGLVEDHSGGYRIEPLRPSGVLVGFRLGEVRPSEARPFETRPTGFGGVHLRTVPPLRARFPTPYVTPFKARLNARRQQRLQMGGEQLQEALGTSIPYGVGSHPVLRYRPAHHRSANRVAAPPRSRWSGVDTSSRTPHMSSRLNFSTLSPAAGFDTTPIAAYGMSSSLARATSG